MTMRTPVRLLLALPLLFGSGVAAQTTAASTASGSTNAGMDVAVTWLDKKPDKVTVSDGHQTFNLQYSTADSTFRITLPSQQSFVQKYVLTAEYDHNDASLDLKLGQNFPVVSFELPRTEPIACNKIVTLQVEKSQHGLAALRSMLEARYLLDIDGNNSCPSELQSRIAKAAAARLAEAAQVYAFLTPGDTFQTQYAAFSGGGQSAANTLQTAITISNSVQAAAAYKYQAAAIQSGDIEKAAQINQALTAQAAADPDFKQGLQAAHVDRLQKDRSLINSRLQAIAARAEQ